MDTYRIYRDGQKIDAGVTAAEAEEYRAIGEGAGYAITVEVEQEAPAPATLDSFRAAWATRLATTRTATTLTMSEHWGLRALMGDDSMPLARHAARQTMAVLTDTGV